MFNLGIEVKKSFYPTGTPESVRTPLSINKCQWHFCTSSAHDKYGCMAWTQLRWVHCTHSTYSTLHYGSVQCNGLHNLLRTPGLNSDEKEWMRMSSLPTQCPITTISKYYPWFWDFQYDGTYSFFKKLLWTLQVFLHPSKIGIKGLWQRDQTSNISSI